MGLLNNIGEKFANTLWSSVNTAANIMAETANSFLYQGGTIVNTGLNNNGIAQFSSFSNEQYFDALYSYHFVSAVLDILSSCIMDLINKSDFHCKITGDEEHTQRANNFIDEIQLKQFVLDNLRDFIYRGKYAFGIDYQKRKLYTIQNPYDFNVVTNTKDIVGYEIGGNILSNDNLIAYYYQIKYEESIGNKDDSNKNSLSFIKEKEDYKMNSNIRDDNDIPIELSNLVVKFKKYSPYGLFDAKLARIFQMYSLEVAMYYLSLRESMKPTLLGVATGGKQINLTNAIDMANAVEGILNSPSANIAQMSDPTIYINQIVWNVLNSIKVMPTLEQYQNLSDIANDQGSQRRDKLNQELENVKKEVLSEFTIPEELFGGTGSRWDQYTRSDRFCSTIDSLLSSISRMVKQIVSKFTGISTVSISFNIDTTALTASFDTKNKLSVLSDKMGDFTRILTSIKDVVENDYIVPNASFDWIKEQLSAIDEKLTPVLITELNQAQDNESEVDTGGEDEGYNL